MDAKRKELGALLIAKTGDVVKHLRYRGIPAVDLPDLAQEVFRRAFEYLLAHGVEGDIGALLRKIGDDLTKDYYRRADTRATYAPTLAEEDLAPTNPEAEFVQHETDLKLHEVIEDLPSPFRDLFAWKFIDNLTNKEIAGILRVSEVTVERRCAQLVHTIEKALRRRGITSPLVVPFEHGENHAQGAGDPDETTDPRLALIRPASTSPPPSRGAWREIGKAVTWAAVGGFLVWLFLRPTTPAPHLSPLVHVSPASFTFTAPTVAPKPFLEPPVCPVVAPPPPSPVQGSPEAGGEPKVDPTPRQIARLCEAAIERGDEVERKRWCSKVTGAFRKAFEERAASDQRTP